MIYRTIERLVTGAVEGLVAEGTVPAEVLTLAPRIDIPPGPQFGDFSTNHGFLIAKRLKRNPRELAQAIIDRIGGDPLFTRVEIAGPGFINFFVARTAFVDDLREIMRLGDRFGSSDRLKDERIIIEFVSANPTGPLHVGNGRGAAVGDVLARVFDRLGAYVFKEYYINDAGSQIATLGRSVYLRELELAGATVRFDEGLYQGHYIREIAGAVREKFGERLATAPESEAVGEVANFAMGEMLTSIRDDLASFGVSFDHWFSERSLYDGDAVAKTIDTLKAHDLTFEQDGALWFRSTRFGDDKDRVLVRASGEPTYFAADVAYHADKIARGFTRIIDIWGADHHGYIPRMKAAVEALGFPQERLDVILYQLVNLFRDGEAVRLSKRTGDIIRLSEVVDEVGADSARYLFLTKNTNSTIDFDLDLVKQQSMNNPVFYVQYAYARIVQILKEAAERGISLPLVDTIDPSYLTEDDHVALIKRISILEEVYLGTAESLDPLRLINYLAEIAQQFHGFYKKHRVISTDPGRTAAMLVLMQGVGVVLRNIFNTIGIQSLERM